MGGYGGMDLEAWTVALFWGGKSRKTSGFPGENVGNMMGIRWNHRGNTVKTWENSLSGKIRGKRWGKSSENDGNVVGRWESMMIGDVCGMS